MRDLRAQELSPAEHLAIVWHYLGKGTWGPPTDAQIALAEAIASPQYDRLAVCMFRGVGKSTVTAAMLPRFWLFNPDLLIGVVAADELLAKKITGQVREILNLVPMFRDLRPKGRSRKARGALDVGGGTTEQTESLWARGIGGNFTGCRADILLVDDGEVPNNCDSQGNRETLWEHVNALGPLLKKNGPSRIQFNGTPHSDNSIYWKLLREKQGTYKMLVWPALYPSEDEERFHGENMHPRVIAVLKAKPELRGTPTDPRFDMRALAQAKIDVGGEANFRRQYQLDPRVNDQNLYPLKFKDLMVMDLDRRAGPLLAIHGKLSPIDGVDHLNVGFDDDRFYPPLNLRSIEWKEYEDKAVFVDPSGAGPDETAYLVAGWVHGYLCILAWGGNTHWGSVVEGNSPNTLGKLLDLAVEWDCNKIVLEHQNATGAFTPLLQQYVRATGKQIGVIDFKLPGGKKGPRIVSAIRPFTEQHRVILNRSIIETDYHHGGRSNDASLSSYRALYQFSHSTAEKDDLPHDDRVDVLALACAFWRDRAAIDATEALRRMDDEELREQWKSSLPDGQKMHDGNGVPERGPPSRFQLTGFDRSRGTIHRGDLGNPNVRGSVGAPNWLQRGRR